MNSSNYSTLYIILNYSLNNNIYKLIDSIKNYCFSFISLSLQYNFQIYLIYNNSYSLLFPSKIKDPTYFLTSNYTEMSKSIVDSVDNFFNNVSLAEDKLSSNDSKNNISPINVIFKKILLEINQKNKSKQSFGEGNFFLFSNNNNEMNDRVLLINDSDNDFENINQKYVFLLKKEKIKIDILSLNKNNKNTTSKGLCLFTNGFFDNVTDTKNNIEQILIQEYIPIQRKELFQKNNGNIKNSTNYNKSISDEDLSCNLCHRVVVNREEKDEKNNNSYSMNYISKNNNNDSNNKINNNINSIKNINLFYFENEKNVFCNNCLEKIRNNNIFKNN